MTLGLHDGSLLNNFTAHLPIAKMGLEMLHEWSWDLKLLVFYRKKKHKIRDSAELEPGTLSV